MNRGIICINCPLGCHMEVSFEPKKDLTEDKISVTGNTCPRGAQYARTEILDPKRIVTATCAIHSQLSQRIPVKTDAPLPKSEIAPLLNMLYTLQLSVPVEMGDIVISNIAHTGVNLIATRSLEH